MGSHHKTFDTTKSKKKELGAMKLCISLAMVATAILLLSSTAEAGCGTDGCCYCTTNEGEVITTGLKAPDCNSGYECTCGYNTEKKTYFGFCDAPGSDKGQSVSAVALEVPDICEVLVC